MIAYLKGKLLQKSENLVLIEVNNVGYEVNISTTTYLNLVNKIDAELFTYLQVREDGISLFGFSTLNEKEFFLKLITVNGVGPKMAMQILSGASLTDLVTSIVAEDTVMLSKVKGVGKKTAERIILELKEKVGDEMLMQSSTNNESIDISNSVVNDTMMALVTLGLTKTDAMKKIKEHYSNEDNVETLVEKVLKNLSR